MKKNETWADIAVELRKIPNESPNPDDFCPWWADGGDCTRCPLGWGGKNCPFPKLADRIEAAGKRAEENHKQELDRAVLNKDFLDCIRYYATAMRETATNCNRLGDAAKLRDTHGVTGGGWYGFDLDGTLAKYDGWRGIDHIGEPVKPMVDLIKRMHDDGKFVKIVTARVAPKEKPEVRPNPYLENHWVIESPDDMPWAVHAEAWTPREFIQDWCYRFLGFVPDIVYQKDHLMLELYDDRVKQVVPNTGILVEDLAERSDTAKLREVLEWAISTIDVSPEVLDETEDWENEVVCWVEELQSRANAALAAPPRNCDVGTAEERQERFNAFCKSHHKECGLGYSVGHPKAKCPAYTDGDCGITWEQMPYEATKEEGGHADT